MKKAEIEYGNDGRTPSLARGLTKGLSRAIYENWQDNRERTKKPYFTNSRNKNYKLNIEFTSKLYDGLIVDFSEYGKAKKREAVFTVLVPTDSHDDFRLLYVIISFRNPKSADLFPMNLIASKHCIERIYQRFAGTDHSLIFTQLKPVLDFTFKIDTAEYRHWEIVTGDGMCIAVVEPCENGECEMTAITWVDKVKLGADQPCEVGEYRMIESTE